MEFSDHITSFLLTSGVGGGAGSGIGGMILQELR